MLLLYLLLVLFRLAIICSTLQGLLGLRYLKIQVSYHCLALQLCGALGESATTLQLLYT